jgi:hypothetical protein
LQKAAKTDIDRPQGTAKEVLKSGMLKDKSDDEIDIAVDKMSAAAGYGSHGDAVGHSEAEALGLAAERPEPDSDLRRRAWSLCCLYDQGAKIGNIRKILESAHYSPSRKPAQTGHAGG